jgi:hypothetical protein
MSVSMGRGRSPMSRRRALAALRHDDPRLRRSVPRIFEPLGIFRPGAPTRWAALDRPVPRRGGAHRKFRAISNEPDRLHRCRRRADVFRREMANEWFRLARGRPEHGRTSRTRPRSDWSAERGRGFSCHGRHLARGPRRDARRDGGERITASRSATRWRPVPDQPMAEPDVIATCARSPDVVDVSGPGVHSLCRVPAPCRDRPPMRSRPDSA